MQRGLPVPYSSQPPPLPSKPPLLSGYGDSSHCCLSLPPLHVPRQQSRQMQGQGLSTAPSPSPPADILSSPAAAPLLGFWGHKDECEGLCLQESEERLPVPLRLERACNPQLSWQPGSPSPCIDAFQPLRPPALFLGPHRRGPGRGYPRGSLHTAFCAGPGAMNGWKPQQNAEPLALGLEAMHPQAYLPQHMHPHMAPSSSSPFSQLHEGLLLPPSNSSLRLPWPPKPLTQRGQTAASPIRAPSSHAPAPTLWSPWHWESFPSPRGPPLAGQWWHGQVVQ